MIGTCPQGDEGPAEEASAAPAYIPDIDLNWLWPAALIALGVVVLLAAFRRPPAESTGPDAPP